MRRSFMANVRALSSITDTLKRCEGQGGFTYNGSDIGVLAASILSDIEGAGLAVAELEGRDR